MTIRKFVGWVEARNPMERILPNKALQLTARNFGFDNVFGVVVGFALSSIFWQIPAATELGSLAVKRRS